MEKNKYCIVGFGNHAQYKILPALEKINSSIVGIVSKKKIKTANYTFYPSLKVAINKVPYDTVFIICSPPSNHFEQVIQLGRKKFNVIVEKPIFIKSEELIKATYIFKKSNNFLFESFMYKETKLYQEFKKLWRENKKDIKKINISFIIPSFPKKTFRQKKLNYPLIIYDIGCYLFNLLNEMNIGLESRNTKIMECTLRKNTYRVKYKKDSFTINLKFGEGGNYENYVLLENNKGNYYKLSPFFYGRSGEKEIIINKKNKKKYLKRIIDYNAFEKFYSKRILYSVNSQLKRNDIMQKNLTNLELIWKMFKFK